MLFIDSLDYYTSNYSGPFLQQLRETTEGLESLKEFFYGLIDALLDKTFPKSCLMVNTIVEMRNENPEVVDRCDKYFDILKESYKIVLQKASVLDQIKEEKDIDKYAEFLLGMIFSLSILYKVNSKKYLQLYIDEQIQLIV